MKLKRCSGWTKINHVCLKTGVMSWGQEVESREKELCRLENSIKVCNSSRSYRICGMQMNRDNDIRECELWQWLINMIFLSPQDYRHTQISTGNKQGMVCEKYMHNKWMRNMSWMFRKSIYHICKVVADEKTNKEEIHKNHNKFKVNIPTVTIS